MLGAIAVDHLVGAVVPLDGEGDLQHVVAGLHDLQDATGLVALLLKGDALLHLLDQLVLHNLECRKKGKRHSRPLIKNRILEVYTQKEKKIFPLLNK